MSPLRQSRPKNRSTTDWTRPTLKSSVSQPNSIPPQVSSYGIRPPVTLTSMTSRVECVCDTFLSLFRVVPYVSFTTPPLEFCLFRPQSLPVPVQSLRSDSKREVYVRVDGTPQGLVRTLPSVTGDWRAEGPYSRWSREKHGTSYLRDS